MNVNWQGYEDGSLSQEETLAAEKSLSQDPTAKRELAGLRGFVRRVRESAIKEPIPLNRLEAGLRAIGHRRTVGLPRLAWISAIVVVAAVLVASIASLIEPGAKEWSDEAQEFSSEIEAQRWARDKSGLTIPTMTLGSIGQIRSAHAHPGWACYDYTVNGSEIHIGVAAGSCGTSDYERVETEHGTLLIDTLGQVVRFEKDSLTFTVRGGTAEDRLLVSKSAIAGASVGRKGRMQRHQGKP